MNLPCPNPTCTHQFSPAEIKGATALKCPRCGTLFQFRQGQGGKPPLPAVRPVMGRPVSGPVAPKPTPSIPVAQPVKPARPVSPRPPVPPSPAETFDVDLVPPPEAAPAAQDFGGERLVSPAIRSRLQRRPSGWKYLIVAFFVLALAGGGIVAFRFLQREQEGSKEEGTAGPAGKFTGEIRNLTNQDEKIFRLVVPKNSWKMDNSIKTGLKAVLALQRTEPDAWLAVAAKDFGTRKPRNAELAKEGIERLENHFGETLELAEKADTGDLAGQRAQRLEFKGSIKQVQWRGECYMFTDHGIGYWFFMAAPTLEEAQQALVDLQKDDGGFKMLNERRGWREQPPKLESFQGSKYPITLTAPEGVWEKFDAADQDERGVLFLFGRYLKEKDNRKNASVLIITLDKQPGLKEALKAARSYFEDKKKDEDKDYRTVPVSDKEDDPGIQGPVGDRPGRFLDLRLQLGNEPKRYWLLAVADGGDRHFVIRCDCTWESRQIWRQDFLDLLRTFKLGKKKSTDDE